MMVSSAGELQVRTEMNIRVLTFVQLVHRLQNEKRRGEKKTEESIGRQ